MMRELPPIRLIARPRSWIAEWAPFLFLGFFLIGYGVGLWQATKYERAISEIKLRSANTRNRMLSATITNALGKKWDVDQMPLVKEE